VITRSIIRARNRKLLRSLSSFDTNIAVFYSSRSNNPHRSTLAQHARYGNRGTVRGPVTRTSLLTNTRYDGTKPQQTAATLGSRKHPDTNNPTNNKQPQHYHQAITI